MPIQKQYLVGLVGDGTMRSLVAHSIRGAAKLFVARYGVPVGVEFRGKARGEGSWEYFSRTSNGIRSLGVE